MEGGLGKCAEKCVGDKKNDTALANKVGGGTGAVAGSVGVGVPKTTKIKD